MDRVNKTLHLQIRVSPQEKATIVRYAKEAHMGISQWILSKSLSPVQQTFQRLVEQLKIKTNSPYILAEIHDMLNEVSANEFELMVSQPPGPGLIDYLANYLAAMIEYAAVQKGKKAPMWAGEIPPLTVPVFGSNLKSLQLYLLMHSPPPFRCRNIFIDATVGQRV